MADEVTLNITARQQVGSQGSHKVRRAGRIPGILYGRGTPTPVSLDDHEFRTTIKPSQYGSAVVNIHLDGQDAGQALVKAVQTIPMGQRIIAVDLQRVSGEDRVTVSVPVVLMGEPEPVRLGSVLEQMVHAVSLRCRADAVPTELVFDVTLLQIGNAVHAAQLALPPGCELQGKPDEVIAMLLAPTVPAGEEPVTIADVAGPELTGDKQKDDFPPER